MLSTNQRTARAVAPARASKHKIKNATKRELKRKQRRSGASLAPVHREAFTIEEFCESHCISVRLYFKIRKAGTGPRERKVNNRTIITAEDAAAWRAAS
jgi:hypothetical protein